jgi:streptogramin lyase
MKVRLLWLLAALLTACTFPSGGSQAAVSPPTSPTSHLLASGGVVEYPVPGLISPELSCCVTDIVASPDGTLWFGLPTGDASDASKIARLNTSGSITAFDIPGGGLNALAAAPDGSIWATAYGESPGPAWILRISAAGKVTRFWAGTPGEFVRGSALGGGSGIAVGPGGYIWFTEWSTSKIGRLDQAGNLTEFSTPTSDTAPSKIVVGPDGNLWFTETNWRHPAIARLTPWLSNFSSITSTLPEGVLNSLSFITSRYLGCSPR